ncbi:MerR family transcriptional regulator [Leuconostoc falkenbergense]|uniref:MerR family transcriptional regulator n=1 Tax=Leuconostoc falkenbergense TaxID=2766470 RepID=UPI0024ADE360|nr:MerR family transcriptional regulator [Leuconostoc falkenbergense]MDI6666712.1 MerR family transcriptional regulator [Leuconostoc falkenbergense]
MYTIGKTSALTGLPISTLRYYDREGLFPDLERVSGIRQFSDKEIEIIRVIECLKRSGLGIKDIKQFMQWSIMGSETFEIRKNLFENQRRVIEKELEDINRVHSMLDFKCWYYETAIKLGSEFLVEELIPERLPQNILESYNKSHK